MKAALLYGVGDLRIVDIPKPAPSEDEVLVRVTVCAVCPTDLRKYRVGDHGVLKFPFNMGHEWVGEVVEVGSRVQHVKPGMRVVGGGYSGYAEYSVLGEPYLRNQDGGPLVIPDGTSDDSATFVEPLADCIHAVCDQARASLGSTVLILGAGQMGLQQLMVSKLVGATVIVTDLMPERLALAERFGADYTIDPAKISDIPAAALELTGGRGVDAAIVTLGSPSAMLTAIDSVRIRGRVVLFGGFDQGTTVTLDPNIIHYKEMEVVGSEWIGARPYHNFSLYPQALKLIEQKKIPVAELVTSRVPLDGILKAFGPVRDPANLKVIVDVDGHSRTK